MKNRIKLIGNTIHNSLAFTLAETLVAILIMLMVSSIMVAGIPAAKRAYDNVKIVSDAEVLLATTVSALRNEIGMATDLAISSDHTSVSYYNSTFGSMSKISLNIPNKEPYDPTDTTDPYKSTEPKRTIMYQRYTVSDGLFGIGDNADGDGGATTITTQPESNEEITRLVSKQASGSDLYVTYSRVSKDGKIVTFEGLEVKKNKGENGESTGVSLESLPIRLIAAS